MAIQKGFRHVILTLGCIMKSMVIKRSVVLSGHKTSVSLEDAFWESFKEIAASRGMPLSTLLTKVEAGHHHEIFPQASAFSCSTTIAGNPALRTWSDRFHRFHSGHTIRARA